MEFYLWKTITFHGSLVNSCIHLLDALTIFSVYDERNKSHIYSWFAIVFFSNFSPEFWLLLLNTGWLGACSGPLRISINIKACICHILGGGGGGGAGVRRVGREYLWAKLRCWWCSADRWLKWRWSCGSHMQNRSLPHCTIHVFKEADSLSLFKR